MKSIFIGLILFISLTSAAQSDKRLVSIREQLQGYWELVNLDDTTVNEKVTRLQFVPGDRLVVTERGRTEIITFSIALSETDTLLIFDGFILQLRSSWTDQRWTVNELHFAEKRYANEKIIKKGPGLALAIHLEPSYVLAEEKEGWTLYPPLVAVPQFDLVLNEDMSFQWDRLGSGTWTLDSTQVILHFNCERGHFLYDIVGLDRGNLWLRPNGIKHADSVLKYTSVDGIIEDHEKKAIEDSVRAADSTYAAMAAMEAMEEMYVYQMQEDSSVFGKKFHGSWEASFTNPMGRKPYQFEWDEKGILLIRSGKKEKKYQWEFGSLVGNAATIKLLRSGKEELAIVEFDVDYDSHRITLTDPFTGKLESFVLIKTDDRP